MKRMQFDDALDSALDAVRAGRPLETVLADYPRHAAEMRPLLEAALSVGVSRRVVAPSPRLAENFATVQAALRRARLEPTPIRMSPNARPVPWWRRPLALASASVPVGLIVLGVLSAGGVAAAATFVITPANLSDVLPDRVADVLTLNDATPPGISGENDAGATGGGSPLTGDATATAEPGNANMPIVKTISGTIRDLNGNTFVLTSGDDEWKVNVDGKTVIDGEIADGASADVSGAVTAEKNMHADDVHVTPPANPSQADSTPQNDSTPDADNTPHSDGTPGPAKTKEPKEEHTPPGRADTTPPGNSGDAPGYDGDPPGQSEEGAGNSGVPPGQADGGNANDGGRKKP